MSKPDVMQLPIPRQDPPAYYTDQVQVLTSGYSCVLFLNRTIGADREGKIMVKPECVMYMSPQHMKSLWLLLGRQIAAWEEKRGEIRLDEQE